ncbi:hypothetical protein, partial [Streptococcus equi]|uniref:hypothetical protein n=1 Tax=Streptococcus equi TaxID=1336 RepID=UPI001F238B7E
KKKKKQNYGEKDELCRFSLPTAMLKSSLRKNVIKNNHSITKGEKNDNQKTEKTKKTHNNQTPVSSSPSSYPHHRKPDGNRTSWK